MKRRIAFRTTGFIVPAIPTETVMPMIAVLMNRGAGAAPVAM
jgi:hypothetical protein